MKRLLVTTLLVALAGAASAQPAYKVKISNNNLVGITVSNYGFFGNNFVSRSPSFEYPLGSGFEHMVRGGLWIGGISDYNDDMPHAYLVSTGATAIAFALLLRHLGVVDFGRFSTVIALVTIAAGLSEAGLQKIEREVAGAGADLERIAERPIGNAAEGLAQLAGHLSLADVSEVDPPLRVIGGRRHIVVALIDVLDPVGALGGGHARGSYAATSGLSPYRVAR